MKLQKFAFGVVCLCVCSAPSVAEEVKGDLLRYMANIYGKCTKAEVAGTDYVAACHAVVVNALYVNGRTSFVFYLNPRTLVSFGGTKDVRPQPEKYRLEVDSMKIVGDKPSTELQGSGACTMDGALDKGVKIQCEIKSQNADASFSFQGNGEVKWIKRPEGT